MGIFYGVLGFAKVYFGWVGVGRNFLWVGKVRWRYILGGWGRGEQRYILSDWW